MNKELIEKVIVIKAFKLARGIEKNTMHFPKVVLTIEKALKKIESLLTSSDLPKNKYKEWILRQIFYYLMLAELFRTKDTDKTIDYRKIVKEISTRENIESLNEFYFVLVNSSEQKTKVVGGGAASEIKKSDVVEKDWKEPLESGSDYQRSGYGPEIWTTLIDMTQISRKTLDFIHHTPLRNIFVEHFGQNWTSENFT